MRTNSLSLATLKSDLPAGLVVFLVALPLCLGIALASGAPLFSGIIAGIVGGLIVGPVSGSHTSVSGPAAGLTAIVLASITALQSFEAFLAAVFVAGLMQIALGLFKAGIIADFVPSNVIKGLLAAVGVILIMKQLPHAVGYDADPEGDFSFFQVDKNNTFSELINMLNYIEIGAVIICLVSLGILLLWEKTSLKNFNYLPGPLVAVASAILLNQLFQMSAPSMALGASHLVSIPIADGFAGFINLFQFPDFTALARPAVWQVAVTLALVASLETLLTIEAADKLDTHKRQTPPNRELLAQGVGNTISGLIGGLPLTSVIVRTSANINSGAASKLSAIFHGVLLLVCAFSVPALLNKIPLACLAAILLFTGYKLAKPAIFKEMYQRGWNQLVPFVVTVTAIVFTDLLIGTLIGLAVSLFFILKSNFKNPFEFAQEKYHVGETIRLQLAPQVSFFNKASIKNTLEQAPDNSNVVIDASASDFIDYDVLEVVDDFKNVQAPERGIKLSLTGFKEKYEMADHVEFVPVLTKDLQTELTPAQTLEILKRGNERFTQGRPLNKNLLRQLDVTAEGQHPMAVVLSCIDSRTSAELIFDLGLGDIFSVRVAGNVVNEDILGSMEFACRVAGAKMIVALGHTACGAIKGACDSVHLGNLTGLLERIKPAVAAETQTTANRTSQNTEFVENVAQLNVGLALRNIMEHSPILAEMIRNHEIGIAGGIYDVKTGEVTFLDEEQSNPTMKTMAASNNR
jgi:MFS superfamily sulfate permease-like transporter